MVTSIAEFVRYFEGVRRRTLAAVARVTPAILDWAPWPGALDCGTIIRHLAGAERFFVTKVVEDRWTDALDPGPKLDLEASRELLAATHSEQMPRLLSLPDARLREQVQDLEGRDVRVWRLLMGMVEHEVHHRSQLNGRLSAAGIGAPQIFGYRMEEVIARARAERP